MEATRTTLYRLRKQMKNITLNQASLKLIAMGLISEIPFQYMICILLDAPLTLHLALTNIFITLFLGSAAIMAYDAFRSRQALQKLSLLPLHIIILVALYTAMH